MENATPSAAPAATSTPVATATPEAAASQEAALEVEATSETITPEEEAELAAAPSDNKEKVASEVKLTKLKIDGEEVELTEDEVRKYASLGKAAQKRMQEAAEIRKQHEKLQSDVNVLLQVLQNDPARVLGDLGIDPQKFAQELINKRLEDEAKTPEQKEKEDMLKKLQAAEKQVKDIEEKRKKEEQDRMTHEAATKIEREINEAIEANNMPKHPYFVRKVADLLILATARKIDVDAKDVIPIAKKQITEEFRSLTGVLPEELLEEILGNDKVASLRRRYLQKLKKTPPIVKNIKPVGSDAKKEAKDEQSFVKAKDFFSKLGTF
jgi:hypothetical protein